MKIIERYVFRSFLSSFLLAFLVLSFVLTIGLLVQIVGYIMDGVPMSLVGRFCAVSLPETLQWSMPLALLVSSILVFSRMSADSEIAAMRACGINLISVIKYPVIFAILCTFLGFWVNNEIVPRGHEVRRMLKTRVSVKTGISLLKPGMTNNDFPNIKIYIGKKDGNWLYDLKVRDFSDPDAIRIISASKAYVEENGSDIDFTIYDAVLDQLSDDNPATISADVYPYRMKNVLNVSSYTRRPKDFCFREMLQNIADMEHTMKSPEATAKFAHPEMEEWFKGELSGRKVELHKRFVFAMASLCFVLIGIPLGIRSQRKESTIGMAISLAVSLGYYALVILVLACEEHYAFYPWLLIWIPVAVCFVLAGRYLKRHL